jgi:trehalose synthase
VNRLEDYREIMGNEAFLDVRKRALKLYDKHFLHVNSTYSGGGVAEILHAVVPLMNTIGIDTGWRVLAGNADFFKVTKRLHNAFQGDPTKMTRADRALYVAQNEEFARYTHVRHDCVIVHDPQPLPLASFYRRRQPWVWQCHLDISQPEPALWDYLTEYILGYDVMIVSSDEYRRPNLPIEQRVFSPAIDPLSPKNIPLTRHQIEASLAEYGIATDKPLVAQVSRFDKWKDPIGVINSFLLVKQDVDCRLVLCGGTASDDPEGQAIYQQVERLARPHVENGDIALVSYGSDTFVNALQRAASVVVQKSTREGFGLTVTEAMWKARPVVSTAVGGIPLQITDGKTGLLCDPHDDRAFADCILRVLNDPEWGQGLGEAAHQRVQERFLITRLLSDYLDLLCDLTS